MRISKLRFTKKPKGFEVGKITKELNNNPELTINLSTIANAIGLGQTLVIDNISGNRKSENFVSTNLIGIDIDDEKYLKNDDAYDLTGDILKANGFEWFMRYKTFSYTDELPKHRYFLYFSKPLNKEQALIIYTALANILPIDKSTINNLCRIWYGSSTQLNADDTPGKSISFSDFDFSDIKIENTINTQKEIIISNAKIEQTLKNIDFKNFDLIKYAEEVVQMHDNWNHEAVYNSVYSVAVIAYRETGDIKPFEIFIANVPHSANKTKIQRQKDYKIAFSNNVKGKLKTPTKALKLLNKLTKNNNIMPDKNIEYKFEDYNMFKGLKKTNLNEREEPFINSDDIAKMKGTSLLVAPAGSGKTTAIIDYALKRSKKHVVLIVPLIPIIEKLESKHQNYTQIEYLYSTSRSGKTSKLTKNSSLKLTICTTEAYYSEQCNNYGKFKHMNHQLFIDEAHEVVSFFGIDGFQARTDINSYRERKGEITKKVFHNAPKDTTFVTATPFNLADVFTQRKIFIKNTDKKVNFIKTRGSKATIIDILKLDKYQSKKTLIYVNSRTKLNNLEKKIKDNFPNLKVSSIFSGGQKKGTISERDYENIMNELPIESDVIITTKYLNVGVDINGVFNLVIYADNKLDINSCLQLFNRERQQCDFVVLHNGKMQEEEVFININSPIKPDKIDVLMDSDINDDIKQLLLHFLVYDDEEKENIISQHIYVDQTKYKKLSMLMNITVLKHIFKWFYPNVTFTYSESVKAFENDKKKPITQQMRANHYKNILKHDLDVNTLEITDFKNYKEECKHDDDAIKHIINTSGIEKISRFEYMCMVKFIQNATNLTPNELALYPVEEHPIFKRRLYTAIKTAFKEADSYNIINIRNTIKKMGDVNIFYLAESVDIEPYKGAKKIGWCLNKLKKSNNLDKQAKESLCDYLNENNFHYNNVRWTPQNFTARAEIFGFYYERKSVKIDGKVVKLTINKTIYS